MNNLEKFVEHPLEDAFGITPNTTLVECKESLPIEIVEMPNYDQKDDEIEYKLEQIYNVAMEQFEVYADTVEEVEGKFRAKIGEVSVAMLNVALGSVKEKRLMKEHKDKLIGSSRNPTINSTTNNNLIIDRNELLRMISSKEVSE